MATLNNIVGGLQVFAKYGGDQHLASAAHEVLYAGTPAGVKLTAEEEKTLSDLGWRYNKTEESWSIFV